MTIFNELIITNKNNCFNPLPNNIRKMWKQIKSFTPVYYTGGWCLDFVERSFGTTKKYATAWEAWESENQQTGEPPLGIQVPVYFYMSKVPAGHIAVRLEDGRVASATLGGYQAQPYYHQSISDLLNYYGTAGPISYVGWTPALAGSEIVKWEEEPTPQVQYQDLDLEDMYTITYKGAGGIWVVAHGIIALMAHPDNYEAVNKLMRFYHIEPAQAFEFDSFAWFLRFVDAYLGTGTKYFDAGGAVRDIYS